MRVAFTGHQNLPDSAITHLISELDRLLATAPNLIGICSLAEGGDQVFAQAVLRSGGILDVVIPCDGYEQTFKLDGLATYFDLHSRARSVRRLNFPAPSEEAYMAAGRQIVDDAEILYACWDGEKSGGLGGTADVVEYARGVGVLVVIIWPEGVTRE